MAKMWQGSNMRHGPFSCFLLLTCGAVPAADLELITKEEAARADDPYHIPVSKGRGPYPPPRILPRMGDVVTSPFTFYVELHPGAKFAKIDPDSFEIIYRKKPPVDLRRRIRPFIDSSNRVVKIRVDNAQAPPGTHNILLRVEDSNGLSVEHLLKIVVELPMPRQDTSLPHRSNAPAVRAPVR